MSSNMKDTELKSILGEIPNWIFGYLELSDDIKREWKLGSKASDFGAHNQFVQTFAKRIEALIKRETDKAVRDIQKEFQKLADEWGLPEISTWQQGRFIDQPKYNRMGADWKQEQSDRERTLIRPGGGTNNALFQVSGAEDNAMIAAYISEVASIVRGLPQLKQQQTRGDEG